MTATPSGRVVAQGKQLLLDGKHLADCRDENAALALRDAFEFAGIGSSKMPPYALRNILAVLL